ncbi:agamous-like MADS-box protein AGL80 [Aristolochia californica]|uniref:agamous-like MADS-box protein AGL80 n=1 Tax=Aristolochia californica TaxID=171875 RepID=UPI0035DE7E72
MVRSKFEMKFIGNERARCKVFKNRVEGVKKKCHRLSMLCGIDVFFLCSPPESEKKLSPHSWPPNKPEVLRILTKYSNRSNEEIRKHPTILSANSLKESLRNLSYKFSGKRDEAKQRLEFPKGMGLVCEGASDRKIETQPRVDHSHNLWLVCEMESQGSNNAYLPIAYMNPFQQSQTGLGLPSDQLFWDKTQSCSSTDLRFKFYQTVT